MSKVIIILIIVIIILLVLLGLYLMLSNRSNNAPVANQNANSNSSTNTFTIQGMKVEVTKEGSGVEAKAGDKVVVNYVGSLINGTKFDSSIDRNSPFSFVLGIGKVIKGWDLGVVGMKVGEKRTLTIPPDLGYGANGVPPIIPKSATLVFQVEMLKIN